MGIVRALEQGNSEILVRCLGGLCVALVLALALLVPRGQASAQPVSLPLPAVELEYFGLVLNRTDTSKPWPNVPFGSWRIWDAYVTWPYLEPEPGQWNFSALDRMVGEAAAHKTKVLLVLAHSPKWASARPAEPSGYKPGFSAEPRNMEDWRNYVRTVATRYKGKIEAYQIWNEPSDKVHFTGTLKQLVDLTCTAYQILKSIDPASKVVSAGTAGGGYHIQYLNDFLAAGGANCIDIVAHHFYVPRYGPEEMVPLIRQVRAVMRKQNVDHLPLWNTETGWWIANTDGAPEHAIVANGGWRMLDPDIELGAAIQRSFLLARAEGVDRFYWYAWQNPYGWGLTNAAGQAKPGVRFWSDVVDRLLGGTLSSCSAENEKYSCDLVKKDGIRIRVKWDDGQALRRREGASSIPISRKMMPVEN